ncbi:MAG: hypothetical protein WBP64_22055 [Nitrososphaeraceae archaeon]
MSFVVDMETADQIPGLAEPLFQGMGVNVELHPLMSFDDLNNTISRMS